MKIFDKNGNPQSFGWLYSEFGGVKIESAPAGSAYRVTELREVVGPAAVVMTVLDGFGLPAKHVPVCWSWPDAPRDPMAGWDKRANVSQTDRTGSAGFAMGKGGFYVTHEDAEKTKPLRGPHALWVYGEGKSDYVGGLGMVAGTNHRHLDVTFQYVPDLDDDDEDEDEDDEPLPSNLSGLLSQLADAMETALDIIEAIQTEIDGE